MTGLRSANAADRPFVEHVYFTTQRWLLEALFGRRGDDFERTKFAEHYREDETSIVVSAEGEDIGWLALRQIADFEIDIDALYLLPSHQNRGIGSALIAGIVAEARSLGASVTLSTAKINPARGLYERLGFVAESEDELKIFFRYRSQ